MSVEILAQARWGEHPLWWPVPPRKMPRWWQFSARKKIADLTTVFGSLDQNALDRFWAEIQKGQSIYEDAGGYALRSYRAMAGERVEEPYTYQQSSSASLEGKRL